MAKVAIIGAGSIVFCKTLILDILHTPGLEDTEFALMAPSTSRTSQVEAFVKRVIKDNNLPAKVWITTDRREALKDADYVIATFQVGGVKAFEADYKIPLKYGVDQCIGDTMGPGGDLPRAAQHPGHDGHGPRHARSCARTPCCSTMSTRWRWSAGHWARPASSSSACATACRPRWISSPAMWACPRNEIDYLCAGINHMAWFLKLEHKGKDLYPLLRERFELPEYYVNEKVRGEAFRQFGYFMTESTGHLSEYLPWFRKNQKALDLYCDEPGFGGETGAYYNWCKYVADKYEGQDILAKASRLRCRSAASSTAPTSSRRWRPGSTFKLNGNVVNDGMIANLPADCCAEGPDLCRPPGPAQDRRRQPPLAVRGAEHDQHQRPAPDREAGLSGDPEKIVQACALDPLYRRRADAQGNPRHGLPKCWKPKSEWLPQFAGQDDPADADHHHPQGCQARKCAGRSGPGDHARFGELAK